MTDYQDRRRRALQLCDLIYASDSRYTTQVQDALWEMDRTYLSSLVSRTWGGVSREAIWYLTRHPRSLELLESLVYLVYQLQDQETFFNPTHFSETARQERNDHP